MDEANQPRPQPENGPAAGEIDLEHIWQFAGHGLRSGDFNTAMVHLYRGELGRSNTWRVRLDATTNWAVITSGAAVTFAFTDPEHTSLVLILNTLLVLLFLFIEARRYRYYELWTYRVRILERNFFAGLLSPPFMPHTDWADRLTQSINQPRFPISLTEALGRRYRRNYAPLFLVLALSWIIKVYIHPTPALTLQEWLSRAAVGPIPAGAVLGAGVVFNGALILMGLLSVGLQEAHGEVLPTGNPLKRLGQRLRQATWEVLEIELPHLPAREQRSQLVYIVSDQAETIGKALLEDLHRGVTLMEGKGMYTGQPHGMLMCAINARQLPRLKEVVKGLDDHAFVVVTPLHSVHGGGFRPLEA